MDQTDILQWLQEVQHPAKGDQSVVALGMVEGIELADGSIHVTLAFPKRPDPLKNYLVGAVEACLYRNAPGGTKIEVDTVVKDPAKPAKKGIEFNLEQLREVRHIIGIASGKGGVGKSTVAVNLAVALARLGYRVGVADADVYGPSIPTMTGTENIEIEMYGEDENNNLFVPVEKYGVKWLSVGHVSSAGQALIWRGPMASTALKQIILQTLWGPLDFLLIDMPPGTGDIHISLIGDVPMSGAVIVTTPQNVALADVLRGVNMFRNPQVNKPIYGLVETCPGSRRKPILRRSTTCLARTAAPRWHRSWKSPCWARFPWCRASVKAVTAENPLRLAPVPTPCPSWNWLKSLPPR